MEYRQKLTESESMIAFFAGFGLTLMIVGFTLTSARGIQTTGALFDLFLPIGVAILILSVAVWLVWRQPWRTSHDDWAKPLYTGHDDHGHPSEEIEAHHDASSVSHETHDMAHVAVTEMPQNEMIASATHIETHVPDAPPASVTAAPVAEIPQPVPSATSGMVYAPHVDMHEDVEATTPTPPMAAAVVQSAELLPLSASTDADEGEDDLTMLEGIGPKIAGALNAAGIHLFTQLAAMAPAEIETIIRAAGVRMVGRAESFPEQARLASEGKFEELRRYQETLKGLRNEPEE